MFGLPYEYSRRVTVMSNTHNRPLTLARLTHRSYVLSASDTFRRSDYRLNVRFRTIVVLTATDRETYSPWSRRYGPRT